MKKIAATKRDASPGHLPARAQPHPHSQVAHVQCPAARPHVATLTSLTTLVASLLLALHYPPGPMLPLGGAHSRLFFRETANAQQKTTDNVRPQLHNAHSRTLVHRRSSQDRAQRRHHPSGPRAASRYQSPDAPRRAALIFPATLLHAALQQQLHRLHRLPRCTPAGAPSDIIQRITTVHLDRRRRHPTWLRQATLCQLPAPHHHPLPSSRLLRPHLLEPLLQPMHHHCPLPPSSPLASTSPPPTTPTLTHTIDSHNCTAPSHHTHNFLLYNKIPS